jgi:hypothetical protein
LDEQGDYMRTLLALTISAAMAGAATLTLALAEGTPAVGISEQAVSTRMQSLGYDAGTVLRHDNHFHLSLVNRAGGGRVDAAFSTTDGELLEAKPADYDEHDH